MDTGKTNEEELTSTMGNLLSTSKEEKNDACDSTPTSSTDAFTTTSTSQLATDDTISSTSSDNLVEKMSEAMPSSSEDVKSSVKLKGRTCSIVSENDLIAMNITDTSTEKITENVDDIVQDLENLLGEPTMSLDFPFNYKDAKGTEECTEKKDVVQEIDELSVELQMIQEKDNEKNVEIPSTLPTVDQTVEDQKIAAIVPESSSLQCEQTNVDAVVTDDSAPLLIEEKINQDDNVTDTCSVEEIQTDPSSEVSTSDRTVVHETDASGLSVTNDLEQRNEKDAVQEEMKVEETDAEYPTSCGDGFTAHSSSLENIEGVVHDKGTEEMEITQNVNTEETLETAVQPLKDSQSDSIAEQDKMEVTDLTVSSENNEEPIVESNMEITPETTTDENKETTEKEPSIEQSIKENTDESKEKSETELSTNKDNMEITDVEATDENKDKSEVEVETSIVEESCQSNTNDKLDETIEMKVTDDTIGESKLETVTVSTVASGKLEESKDTLDSVDTLPMVETETKPKSPELIELQSVAVSEPIPVSEEHSLTEKEHQGVISLEPLVTEIIPVQPESSETELKKEDKIEIQSSNIVNLVEIEKEEENVKSMEETVSDINAETLPVPQLAEHLEALIQDTIEEETTDITPPQDPSSFIETSNLFIAEVLPPSHETAETNILAEVIEDVPDLEVLNAISSLNDDKSNLVQSLGSDIRENDALLASSGIQQLSESDVSFEPSVQSVLPTADEIITEQDQQQSEELQDDNLETLLAVANLENDYNIPPVENFEFNESQFCAKESTTSVSENDIVAVDKGAKSELVTQIDKLEDPLSINIEDSGSSSTEMEKNSNALVETMVKSEEVTQHQDNKLQDPLSINMEVSGKDPVYSPRLTIKPIKPCTQTMEGEGASSSLEVEKPIAMVEKMVKSEQENKMEEPMTTNIEDSDKKCLYSPRLTIKPIKPCSDNMEGQLVSPDIKVEENSNATVEKRVKHEQVIQGDKLKEPLSINIEDSDKDRVYSPRLTIKPIKPCADTLEGEVASPSMEVDEKESSKGSIKMTITKQSDNMHSILKIYDPDADSQSQEVQTESTVPKLIIKSIVQPTEQPQSPKLSRSSKQVFSPSSSQRSSSPRITIKPIPKPENLEPVVPKIIIKPVLKPEESHRQKHSPKLTIKPIVKPDEEMISETKVHSPRVTIKPIVKPSEEIEQVVSPRITIKPIVKPENVSESLPTTPRVTIKPVMKPHDKDKNSEEQVVEKSSPKITIKPIIKPQEMECQEEYEESVKERIVLKINKGTIPSSSKERKRELVQEEEKSEKLAKIKLKFSKEGGHPHIVQTESHTKRDSYYDHDKPKRQKIESDLLPGVTITPIPTHSKLKEMLCRSVGYSSDKVVTIDDDDDDVTIVEERSKPSPIVISEESNQDSINVATDMRDPISDIPVFEITPDSVKTLNPQPVPPVVEVPAPAPRKRGRPRKVPLQVREDFKEEPKPVVESTRPKRSCRGQSVRTTLGIKPRKPRGPGRGRGGKRGMGTRATPTPPEMSPKAAKEPKLTAAKLKQQIKENLLLLADKIETSKSIEIEDGFRKSPLGPPQNENSGLDRADIVMYEEETRMSAEISSRAQTPAKQVVTSVDLVEESQSSIQSTATTESAKVRKGPRLEVHQEPEGAVISADQLAEYYWSGGGPFMLQEQVAQFLGIKSFKRKYPNIQRRVVDMQERDFIRESGLAGEAMCDLGLTAVNSTDILDIMYSDFQDKYEEYCKHQRDRQAKDLTNKQKALSLAASQEKTKMDITQQAVQSAANWNATFNKARRDQRKACMDLQTLTVHFPKGKMKQINKPKMGYYPVALVPGQFTDYYREFTPTEINNLPLNTLCYDAVIKGTNEMECDSQTDGSGSESDTSSSDSDSSYSGSSDGEDCTLCKHTPKKMATV